MSAIAVVIPTIKGREHLHERTVAAYRATAPDHELVFYTARDYPTIGEAWNAGADEAALSRASRLGGPDYLHLTADDVEPQPGWLDAAIEAADQDFYPSPRIIRPDGSTEACGSMGGGMLLADCSDWTPCVTSPFPFMRMENWTPGACLPIGYYADDWLSHLARQAGLKPVVRTSYCLTHLEGTVGRTPVVARAGQDRQTFLDAVAGKETPCVSS
jgi:hypothetical protein